MADDRIALVSLFFNVPKHSREDAEDENGNQAKCQ